MGQRRRRHTALTLSTVLTALAVLDAGRERSWDLVVLLGAALLLQLGLVAAGTGARREVALRADLYAWAAQRSADTGEDLDHVADRCVAAYRAGLTSDAAEPAATPSARQHGRHAAVPAQPVPTAGPRS